MAKGQLRSNKEAKKPKQVKPKPAPGTVSGWATPAKAPLSDKPREKK